MHACALAMSSPGYSNLLMTAKWLGNKCSPRRRRSVSDRGTSTRPRKRELAMTFTGSTVSRCSCSLLREPPTSQASTTSSLAAQISLKNSASSQVGLRLCHWTVVSCDWSPTRTRAKGCVSRCCPCSCSACKVGTTYGSAASHACFKAPLFIRPGKCSMQLPGGTALVHQAIY